MKKIINVLIIAVCTLLLLSACQAQGGVAKQVLNEITKDKYEGRLIGTKGNALAAEYLASLLENIKIKPYFSGGYLQYYQQITADPNLQKPRVTIHFEDGSMQELVHGKDFVTSAASEAINAKLPLVFNTSEAIGNVLPIIETGDYSSLPSSFTGNSIIQADDEFNLVVGSPLSKLPFKITISSSLRDNLVEKKAVSASISCGYAAVESTLSNVVGVIPAKEKTVKALVLTAHFDFIGHQGNFKYQGATDNASGVSTLMSVATRLQELTANAPRDFDIIIAAVNSEETNEHFGFFQGSNELVKAISADYKDIRNINIDCVGSNGSPTLAMGAVSPESEPFAESFRSVLTAENIAFSNDHYGGGDHLSFTGASYPAICVGEDTLSVETQHIHSILNTASDINPEVMEVIAKSVAQFVMDEDADHFISIAKAFEATGASVPLSDEWNEDVLATRDEILNGRKLKLNESITFMFGNQLVWVGAEDQKMTVELLSEYYSALNIPEDIQGFKLVDDINIGTPDITYISILGGSKRDDKALKTIEQSQIKGENVNRFNILYKSEKNDNKNSMRIIGSKYDEPNYVFKQRSEMSNLIPLEGKYAGYTLLTSDKKTTENFSSVYFAAIGWEYVVVISGDDTFKYAREELEQFLDEYDLLSFVKQIRF